MIIMLICEDILNIGLIGCSSHLWPLGVSVDPFICPRKRDRYLIDQQRSSGVFLTIYSELFSYFMQRGLIMFI